MLDEDDATVSGTYGGTSRASYDDRVSRVSRDDAEPTRGGEICDVKVVGACAVLECVLECDSCTDDACDDDSGAGAGVECRLPDCDDDVYCDSRVEEDTCRAGDVVRGEMRPAVDTNRGDGARGDTEPRPCESTVSDARVGDSMMWDDDVDVTCGTEPLCDVDVVSWMVCTRRPVSDTGRTGLT